VFRPVRELSPPVRPRNLLGSSGGNQIVPTDAATAEANSPLRRIAFKMALVLVFIRFSIVHMLLTYVLHINLYLLYLFGGPTLLGVAFAGGVQRTLRGRPAIIWLMFAGWLIAAAPFSTWRGGVVGSLILYFRTNFPMLFVIAGLTLTWSECRSMMRAIAWAVPTVMLAAGIFPSGGDPGARLTLEFGSIADSNDYACHLVLVLPFLIWVALSTKSKALQLAAWGGVSYGVLLILKTASRGGLVALGAGCLYWLVRGTMRQRIALLALGPVVAFALVAFVPRSSLIRILSFSAADEGASEEAIGSSTMRRYLLEQSIRYTMQHPIFGIGMNQFPIFEGNHSQIFGNHGYWHETHNTYTQISSECGVPGLVLYVAAMVSAFFLVNRVYRKARERPECKDIRTTTFCIMLAMTTYCTATAFLTFGYFFYPLAISSLAIAVSRAAQDEFASRSSSSLETQPGFAPQYYQLPRRKPVAPAAKLTKPV
jgi:O-antigen ligase